MKTCDMTDEQIRAYINELSTFKLIAMVGRLAAWEALMAAGCDAMLYPAQPSIGDRALAPEQIIVMTDELEKQLTKRLPGPR